MEQVIFHPYWGVPESIKRDGRPAEPDARQHAASSPSTTCKIQRGGRDVDPATVDWATADIRQFHVYQPPGENNVLGDIKFRFPNKHDVYMHDTPHEEPVQRATCAPSATAACACATRSGWPSCCWPRTRAGRRSASPRPSRRRAAEQPGQPRPQDPRAHHLFHRRGGAMTASSSCSPTSTATRAIALGMEGKAHLIPRKEKAPGSAPMRSAASPRARGRRLRQEGLGPRGVFGNN